MDSGASFLMMSKNELAAVEEDSINKSKEPTVFTTARRCEAESTEESDSVRQRFGRLFHNGAVGRLTSSAISVFIVRRNRLLLGLETWRVSVVDVRLKSYKVQV